MNNKELLLSIILTLKEYEDNLDNGVNPSDVSDDICGYISFLGDYLTKKDVKSSKCSNCNKETAVDGVTPLDMLKQVYKFIDNPMNCNKSKMSGYALTVRNFITSYKEMMNKH